MIADVAKRAGLTVAALGWILIGGLCADLLWEKAPYLALISFYACCRIPFGWRWP